MESDEAVERLRALRDAISSLPASRSSVEFNAWQPQTRSVLERALGRTHHITERFVQMTWLPTWPHTASGRRAAEDRAFRESQTTAQGLIDAAIAELELLADEAWPVADESGVDAELWEHVAPEIASESWAKVASQAALFTEDRIRKWAGRPDGEVGKDLAVAVFGTAGQFQMGRTAGQTNGWQLFAQGFAQAVRNVDAHIIQERPDLKRYSMGVVGACSLLLTQMRYEHGNRFQDTSPANAADAASD